MFSFIKCIKKVYRKENNEIADEKKRMTNAIEETKLTVMIIRLLWEFNLYCKFVFTNKKMNKIKRTKKNLSFKLLKMGAKFQVNQ